MKLRTFCLACREHTNNIGSKKVTMKNKVIRQIKMRSMFI